MNVYIKDGDIIYKWEEQYQNWIVFEYDTVINTVEYWYEDDIIYSDWILKIYEPPKKIEKVEIVTLSFEQIRRNRVKPKPIEIEFERIRDPNVALFIQSQNA